jgi:nucleoside recognition membrane protein YjiH
MDVKFRVQINRNWANQTMVNHSTGIEVWQMVLIGIGCIFLSLVIGCTITKFLLRLGIPKFKPWPINNQYYPAENK